MGNLTQNQRAFFVTGTDTEIGKTFIGQGLLFALNKRGYLTAAYKPIAAGCDNTAQGLRNEDALALQSSTSLPLQYDEVNPIAFEAAIAPHIALQAQSVEGEAQCISIDTIRNGFLHIFQKEPNVIVVEGAGGWRLPLGVDFEGKPRYLSEFVAELNLSVILVVGMRLGCLNHAILTAESIRNDGLKIAGWVANKIEPDMPMLEENIESLKSFINAPFLGAIPRLNSPAEVGAYLDLDVMGL